MNTVPFFHWNGPERPGTLRKREMELTVAPFQSFRYRSGPGCVPVVLRSSVVQVVKLTADGTVVSFFFFFVFFFCFFFFFVFLFVFFFCCCFFVFFCLFVFDGFFFFCFVYFLSFFFFFYLFFFCLFVCLFSCFFVVFFLSETIRPDISNESFT